MRRLFLVVLGASACGFRAGNERPADADLDAPDASPICMTWNARHFDPCALGSPQSAVELTAAASPYTYDTTMSGGVLTDNTMTVIATSNITITQPDDSIVAVFNLERFRIDAGIEVFVIGDKPLLIASWDTIEIGGTIDAGSYFGGRTGAGANPAACAGHEGGIGTIAVATGGSGGGGGGGFQGAGGGGATGDNPPAAAGGPGGVALAAAPAVIHGGCPGARSGLAGPGAADPNAFSQPGAGGGAIEIAARLGITVSGRLLSGGAAGGGAPSTSACGGGGAGSGGYVGLDSVDISFVDGAVVAANGGGGGGAGPFAGPGFAGTDGLPSAMPAPGGPHSTANPTCGEPGFPGGALATPNAPDGIHNGDGCGGGGGGGGVGFVLAWSTTFAGSGGAVVSPALVRNPN